MVRPSGVGGVDEVGADQVAGARHVLHDEGRARQMLLHELGDEAAVGVVAAAGIGRDDVVDGLAVEELGGIVRQRCAGPEPGD